jgi:hypothetical protein
LVEEYRSVTQCNIGDGSTVLFWKDFWAHGELLSDRYPRLYSFALDEDVSVASFHTTEDIFSFFALPLSVEAFQELQMVSQLLLEKPINESIHDQRTFVWGTSYAPSKFYNFLFAQLPTEAAFTAIWKSKMLPKLKVFTWLLFHDRLNTRDLMARKNWQLNSGSECVLCSSQNLETRDHLFFECSFAQQCWESINIHWNMTQPIPNRVILAKRNFGGPCFMEVMACAAWNLWKVRNDLIFQEQPASVGRWKVRFQHDLMLHQYKVQTALVQPLIDWLQDIFVI